MALKNPLSKTRFYLNQVMICWLISVSNPNLGKIHAFLENNLDVIFIIQISFKPIECYF